MNEIDKIFDAFEKASVLMGLEDRKRKKLKQLQSVQRRKCGNCFHWMKSSCKAEKVHGQFKSGETFACAEFKLQDSGRLIDTFKMELVEIEQQIKTAGDES